MTSGCEAADVSAAGGGCWIRTYVAFATVFQTAPFGRSGNPPCTTHYVWRASKDSGSRGVTRNWVGSGGRAETDRSTGVVVMAANPSFDIVSKVDRQEVDNALQQTARELNTRFDFRGTGAKISWAGDDAVTLEAETESRVLAALDVFKEKLVKRKVSLKNLEVGEPRASG